MTAAQWNQIKAFIKFVGGSFEISQRGTHVGLITFSDTSNIAFAFNALRGSGYTKQAFNGLVDGVKQRGRGRRIDLALQMALQQLFTEKNGARKNARKVSQANIFAIENKLLY